MFRPTFPGHPREIYITRQEQVVLVYTKPTFYIWKECLAQPFQGTHEKSTLRDKSKLATATCSQGNHLLFKYFYCLSCIFFDLIWCLENIREAKKRWMWQPYLYTFTSVCIFSILLSIHVLRCWEGDFVWQSKASWLVIISFILLKLMSDLGVVL